jgi:hypothetical protein
MIPPLNPNSLINIFVKETKSLPAVDYMATIQKGKLNIRMRQILVDWLYEVRHQFSVSNGNHVYSLQPL